MRFPASTVCLVSILSLVNQACGYHTKKHGDGDLPLFLTPFIESGNITQAQSLAKVELTTRLGVDSYSGYITVNKRFGSNLFFWYFPSLSHHESPLVIWLQGGPGSTSMLGLFAEHGPLQIENNDFGYRKFNWATGFNMIYVDNPVGTGFSFANDSKAYARNETAVGRDLYEFISQFLRLFPEMSNRDLYVSGEAYGGKFAVALSYTIYQKNQLSPNKINLKGVTIGNGFIDPINQLNYGDYLYQLGLIDESQRTLFHEYESRCVQNIIGERWIDAFKSFDEIIMGDIHHGKSLLYNTTGYRYFLNYMKADGKVDFDSFVSLLDTPSIRRSIHIGVVPFNRGPQVEMNMIEDIMQSVAPWLEELLSHYRVLVYYGQLDLIMAYPMAENYLAKLNFSSAADYATAKRHIWVVDGEIAGYVKSAGLLTEVLVRNAGNMVPADQPKWSYDMLNRFVMQKSFK